MALSGTGASIYIASGTGVSMTDEACTAFQTRTVYRVTDAAKRALDLSATWVIEHNIGGGMITVDPDAYPYQIAGGGIVFVNSEPVGAAVQVTGKYLPVTEVGGAREWSLDIEAEALDASSFGDTWKTITPALRQASGSLSGWYVDETYVEAVTTAPIVVRCFETASKHYVVGGYLTKAGVKVVVDGLVEESLDFTASGPAIYFTTN